MRILLVCGSLPPLRCGVGDYTFQLATHLAMHQAGIEVAVITSTTPAPDAPAAFVRLAVMDDWSITRTMRLLRQMREWQPDIVHIQYPSQGYRRGMLPELIPLLAKFGLGVPVIQTWHEFWHPLRINRALRVLACDAVVFVRTNFRQWMPPWVRRMLRHHPASFIPSAPTIPRSRLCPEALQNIKTRLSGTKRLIAYFGFALPHKGVEDLFVIANPDHDHLVLICDLDSTDPYHRGLRALAQTPEWLGSVTITGFLPPVEVADLLAAADAVLLPFRSGGGEWNTSICAAEQQGTRVITTGNERPGYDPKRNVHVVAPGDIDGLRQALHSIPAKSLTPSQIPSTLPDWRQIAERHIEVYSEALGCRRSTGRATS